MKTLVGSYVIKGKILFFPFWKHGLGPSCENRCEIYFDTLSKSRKCWLLLSKFMQKMLVTSFKDSRTVLFAD